MRGMAAKGQGESLEVVEIFSLLIVMVLGRWIVGQNSELHT